MSFTGYRLIWLWSYVYQTVTWLMVNEIVNLRVMGLSPVSSIAGPKPAYERGGLGIGLATRPCEKQSAMETTYCIMANAFCPTVQYVLSLTDRCYEFILKAKFRENETSKPFSQYTAENRCYSKSSFLSCCICLIWLWSYVYQTVTSAPPPPFCCLREIWIF